MSGLEGIVRKQLLKGHCRKESEKQTGLEIRAGKNEWGQEQTVKGSLV
jgi:hypothetical protein